MVFALLCSSTVIALPDSIPGVETLNAESLIELAHTNEELLVIDSRIHEDRRLGYIEGSVSLPDTRTSCRTLGKISKQKSRPMVFYCNGVKCGRSVKALQIAQQCNYQRLYWFRGGFEEWRLKDYPYLLE